MLFITVTQRIKQVLTTMDNKKLLHQFSIALADVLDYRKHVVRAVHQSRSKIATMDQVDTENILVILDFAMKQLPERFRERQADFFGKKGKYKYCTAKSSNFFACVTLFAPITQTKIQSPDWSS